MAGALTTIVNRYTTLSQYGVKGTTQGALQMERLEMNLVERSSSTVSARKTTRLSNNLLFHYRPRSLLRSVVLWGEVFELGNA